MSGTKMAWQADCGHSMIVYSLEPTPSRCPDCANVAYEFIREWEDNISHAESETSDAWIEDVAGWVKEEGIPVDASIVKRLQAISNRVGEAYSDLEWASRDMWKILMEVPRVEKLSLT